MPEGVEEVNESPEGDGDLLHPDIRAAKMIVEKVVNLTSDPEFSPSLEEVALALNGVSKTATLLAMFYLMTRLMPRRI